ncbi:DEAD/DEAH box helicase [Micromonospora sp. WMMD1082]|uniref:DEAD/DEAH box helicase n=1 Tax=Micromonospora sp. WMMD1082 TaxID=3016104 RepID=UPI002416F7A6|nr:DEAD/DEAH box helicase [Micromonospora sp. WMMD1082]MDG4795030.1 Helicase associated domain protein [Micromonospora sp. WMMD1082]
MSATATTMPNAHGWQVSAVEAASAALQSGGRGQIIAACGTGKTITAAHVALQTCPADGTIVVACPTVALVAQVMQVWDGACDRVLAVCGDDGTSEPEVAGADLPAVVTTDPDVIASWLIERPRGRRLIVTTHRSAGLLGQAMRRVGRVADILVVDEAHHTAGRDDKHSALLHDDTTLPARRRLYLTATPRLGDTADDTAALSMDDPAVFGPVLYRYPFAQAIADKWLDDYRIAIVAVTRAELLPLLRRLTGPGRPRATNGTEAADGPLRTAMVVAAMARAAAEFDLQRTIVYHPRIATSRAFAEAMPDILAALATTTEPARPVTCHHVDGRHDGTYRREVLADLADPPGGGWTVVSNARILGEGIDIPAVDSVVFARPKTSPIDIIQTIGRALRRNPAGSGVATILVPVLAADQPDAATQADLVGYDTIWEVVRGLRAHDETLAAALDLQRQSGTADRWTLPDNIVVRVPDGYDVEQYLQHLTIRLVTATTSPWWGGYGAAVAYHAAFGHLGVAVDYVTDSGYALGRWLAHQREARRKGLLAAARIAALDSLGMQWDPRGVRWQVGLAHAIAFREREGHLRVSPEYIAPDGYPLGQWIRTQRKTYHAGRPDPDRTAILEALGIEWSPYEEMWRRGITAATAYHARHGHLRVPGGHVEADGYRLGQFIIAQRMLYKRGTLAPDRIAALEALGIIWGYREQRFNLGLAAAAHYHRAHGNLIVSNGYKTADGYPLGPWLKTQRAKLRAGQLAPDRIRALDEISPTWRIGQ